MGDNFKIFKIDCCFTSSRQYFSQQVNYVEFQQWIGKGRALRLPLEKLSHLWRTSASTMECLFCFPGTIFAKGGPIFIYPALIKRHPFSSNTTYRQKANRLFQYPGCFLKKKIYWNSHYLSWRFYYD